MCRPGRTAHNAEAVPHTVVLSASEEQPHVASPAGCCALLLAAAGNMQNTCMSVL
jgi:hypothetical protein